MSIYKDRFDAGNKLAKRLEDYSNRKDVLIFALPRGGVPVAFEVAKQLYIPLDIFLVRKLGTPYNEELAMGAVTSGGTVFLNQEIIDYYGISQDDIEQIKKRELQVIERRNKIYRQGKDYPNIENKTIILIDDGLATGATAIAAIEALKKQNPAEIILAVPVGAPSTCSKLRKYANQVICLVTPINFYAVGQAYLNFPQITDEEVLQLLKNCKY